MDIRILNRFRDRLKQKLQAKTGWGRVELGRVIDQTYTEVLSEQLQLLTERMERNGA